MATSDFATSGFDAAMSHAVAHDELVLRYQPIVRVRTGALEGFEALVRWARPEVGLVPPEAFIPAAEESELICEIDTWVLNNAAEQAARWVPHCGRRDGSRRLTVAVNISGRHVNAARLRGDVTSALRRSGLEPDRLVLEITETVLVGGVHAEQNLREVRRAGVALSLDDFGTGHSTVARLSRLPLDVVKIDKSFLDVSTATSRERYRSMVDTVHAFGLPVVAEGVERPDQLEFLRTAGVESAQGFALGRPMSAAALETAVSSYP